MYIWSGDTDTQAVTPPNRSLGFPGGARGKRICLQMQETQEMWVPSWVRKIPWGRKWHPTLVFLPGESHGQRSLAGYSHGVVGTRVPKSGSRLSEHADHVTCAPRWQNDRVAKRWSVQVRIQLPTSSLGHLEQVLQLNSHICVFQTQVTRALSFQSSEHSLHWYS